MISLTHLPLMTILSLLSFFLQKKKSRAGTPFLTGHQMTAPLAVFLRLSFRAALVRFYFMAGCIGQACAWPFLLTVVPTRYISRLPKFGTFAWRFIHINRIDPMKTSENPHVQNPSASLPDKKIISRFVLFKKTSVGRLLICQNLDFDQAIEIDASLIKFQKFEVSL